MLWLLEIAEWRTFGGIIVFILLFSWESLWPAVPRFATQKIRWVHFLRNVSIGAINLILVATVLAALVWTAMEWSEKHNLGVLHRLTNRLWVHAIIAFLVLDLWMYIWHRLNHRVSFLWRFHRAHHSDPEMDVTTAVRFHVGEVLMSYLSQVFVLAFLGVYVWEFLIYAFAFNVVVQFHHSNVYFSEKIDKVFRLFIATPGMHRIHHSRLSRELNSNYSSVFSIWDRLLKTFRIRPDSDATYVGLNGFDDREYQEVLGIITTPLKK